MNFRFTNEYKTSRLDEVIEYTLGARLWIPQNNYPDIFDWANKAHKELKSQAKRALVAFDHNEIVGVTIYQQNKKDKTALELKNITVRPDRRGRHIASFLLRNTEIEGKRNFKVDKIMLDAKVNNVAIRNFLFRANYSIIGKEDLYGLGSGDDYIYSKPLP